MIRTMRIGKASQRNNLKCRAMTDRASEPFGWLMKARHGPPHVGTMVWASRGGLGAGGLNGADRVIHKRDEEPHRAGP